MCNHFLALAADQQACQPSQAARAHDDEIHVASFCNDQDRLSGKASKLSFIIIIQEIRSQFPFNRPDPIGLFWVG